MHKSHETDKLVHSVMKTYMDAESWETAFRALLTHSIAMESARYEARSVAETLRDAYEPDERFAWENATAQTPPDSGTKNHG